MSTASPERLRINDMLNFECVDEIESGNVELCFTDSDGDDAVKIIVTRKTIWDIAREVQRKFSYAASVRKACLKTERRMLWKNGK